MSVESPRHRERTRKRPIGRIDSRKELSTRGGLSLAKILSALRSRGNRVEVKGMARFVIPPQKVLGVPMPALAKRAKQIGHCHQFAEELWSTGIHAARLLAAMIDSPGDVTEIQMEQWAIDFDNWAVVDGCCGKLFDKTPYAYRKAAQWSQRKEEYVKPAAFSLKAWLSAHDKSAPESRFLRFLPIIERAAKDERNVVKKAVNWALRQIGKRNLRLNRAAIETAQAIRLRDSKSAPWIAADAMGELRSDAVQERLTGLTGRQPTALSRATRDQDL
jgi:3-methyladenine DNA glycosylase AlkD